MKKLFITLIPCLLTACGTIGNTVISDRSLQEKAAFALNTTAEKVKISQRTAGLDDIRFVASIGKRHHQCYITTVAGVISSDAICSGAGSANKSAVKNNKNPNCNALLKAANRC